MTDLLIDRGSEIITASMESLLGQAADDFTQRLNRGEQPDIEEYASRYPQIAALLRQVLPALQMLRVPAADSGEAIQPQGTLGDFCIHREIGRGGMGVVYEAEQISLGRRVALKVLPFASALDSKQLQRFKNEAHAAAHLQHQNIVPVYAVGCERGVHFYAMQFVEGQTLAALIRDLRQLEGREGEARREGEAPAEPLPKVGSNPLQRVGDRPAEAGHYEPPREPRQGMPAYAPRPPEGLASELVSGRWAPAKPSVGDSPPTGPYVPSAPDHAPDTATVTPRKPGATSGRSTNKPAFFRTAANLGIQAAEALEHAHQLGVIHRDIKPANLMVDARGNLWITDFGLAHCQGAVELTMSGDLLGTLRYMSPEQALAQRVLVDQRTDIYSLGVTLYELLTLEPVFPGRDRRELLRQIAFDEPKPPRRVNRAVPADLETIVGKALEKNPADRYATAQELADDLERYLKDEPIRARRPSLIQRALKWAKRRPALATAYGLLLIVVMLAPASGMAAWLWQKAETAKKHAQTDRQDAMNARDQLEREKKNVDKAFSREAGLTRQLDLLSYVHRIQLAQRDWNDQQAARADQRLDECPVHLRNWEWHHLKRICHPEQLCLRGHVDLVHAVAYSRDGLLVASLGDDKTVRLWDAKTGRCLRSLSGDCDSVAFSNDGKLLVTVGKDGIFTGSLDEIRLWDVQTGETKLKLNAQCPVAVDLSPDGKYLAVSCQILGVVKGNPIPIPTSGEVTIWNGITGNQIRTIKEWKKAPDSLAFSPASKYLTVVAVGEPVKVFELPSGEESLSKKWKSRGLSALAATRDGKLIVGSDRGDLKIWDASTGDERLTLKGIQDFNASLTFSSNGKYLGALTDGGELKIWDTSTGDERLTLKGIQDIKAWFTFSSNDKYLAAFDGTLRIWEISTGVEVVGLRVMKAFHGLAFSPDAKRFAIADGREVKVYEIAKAGVVTNLKPFANAEPLPAGLTRRRVEDLAFSPDGTRLAVSSSDKTVKIWDLLTKQVLFALGKQEVDIVRVAFNPRGDQLALGEVNGAVKIWDFLSSKKPTELCRHSWGSVYMLAFNQDGTLLTSAADGNILVFDVAKGRLSMSFTPHTFRLIAAAITRDGRLLVSAGLERSENAGIETQGGDLRSLGFRDQLRLAQSLRPCVKLWTMRSGKLLSTIEGFTDPDLPMMGTVVAISSEGNHVVTCCGANTLKLWDANSGQEILTFKGSMKGAFGFGHVVLQVDLSPDGKRLVSYNEKSVVLWDVESGQEILNLEGHHEKVKKVAFSPDGRRLASVSDDGVVKIWDGTPLQDAPVRGAGGP